MKPQTPPWDYRELLKRYMMHIENIESITYVDSLDYDRLLTEEELAELKRLEDELHQEWTR